MARNQGPPSDDPFYRRGQATRESLADEPLPLDAGLVDDDEGDDEPQFRRGNKRVPVRRGALPLKTASRVRYIAVLALILAVLATGVYEFYEFAMHSWRFRVRKETIEISGEAPNSRAQIMQRMRDVIGRNVFQVSLADRKRELEKIPWVESASVMRFWPNRIRVVVKERVPVAFVAIGDRVELIDAQGVLMDLATGAKSDYSFPVIQGMNENEPLSTRAPRMRTFMRLIRELDNGDGSATAKVQYSRNLDEVDLSDPDDVKVMARGGSEPILLHLGTEKFLQCFMVFLSNVQKWEQEHGKLESVDLRYGRQIILNPDMRVAAPPPPPNVEAQAAPKHKPPVKKAQIGHRPQQKKRK